MRKHDEAAIYPLPRCTAGCGTLWEKICRGCNLAYCANHAAPAFHKCRSLEEPEPVKESSKEIPLVVPIKPPGRKRKNVPTVSDAQVELPLEKPPEKTE
jgi:hypothetical protein